MQCRAVLVHYCCRLGAAVATRLVEIHRVDNILAEMTFKCGAAIHRFGRVISHFSIVVLLPVQAWGKRCAPFEQERCPLKRISQSLSSLKKSRRERGSWRFSGHQFLGQRYRRAQAGNSGGTRCQGCRCQTLCLVNAARCRGDQQRQVPRFPLYREG
jgi:hypothetical protein